MSDTTHDPKPDEALGGGHTEPPEPTDPPEAHDPDASTPDEPADEPESEAAAVEPVESDESFDEPESAATSVEAAESDESFGESGSDATTALPPEPEPLTEGTTPEGSSDVVASDESDEDAAGVDQVAEEPDTVTTEGAADVEEPDQEAIGADETAQPPDAAAVDVLPAESPETDESTEVAETAAAAGAVETLPTAEVADDQAPGAERTAQWRSRWSQILVGFVDDPRQTVEAAEALVDDVLDEVTATLEAERTELKGQWRSGEEPSTEDLRLALQRCRTLFDRLAGI